MNRQTKQDAIADDNERSWRYLYAGDGQLSRLPRSCRIPLGCGGESLSLCIVMRADSNMC